MDLTTIDACRVCGNAQLETVFDIGAQYLQGSFVMQGMTKHEIGYIAKTALPMFALMMVMVAILVRWPAIATFLPETMRQVPGG